MHGRAALYVRAYVTYVKIGLNLNAIQTQKNAFSTLLQVCYLFESLSLEKGIP